jgi:hypothetical protein
VVDAEGKQVLSTTEFAAGIHVMNLPSVSAMLFVQIRSGMSTTTLRVEPLH